MRVHRRAFALSASASVERPVGQGRRFDLFLVICLDVEPSR